MNGMQRVDHVEEALPLIVVGLPEKASKPCEHGYIRSWKLDAGDSGHD
jgi:hypothetical protein